MEKTRAPSFARSAASGRPTTSELKENEKDQTAPMILKTKESAQNQSLVPIDHGNSLPISTVAVLQDCVIHADVLEALYDSKRCAWKDRFDESWWRVIRHGR